MRPLLALRPLRLGQHLRSKLTQYKKTKLEGLTQALFSLFARCIYAPTAEHKSVRVLKFRDDFDPIHEGETMDTLDVIKKLLQENADVDPEKVTEDATMEDLGLDSIDLAELICNLEDELGIDFGNPQDLKTIGDVVNHIKSLG